MSSNSRVQILLPVAVDQAFDYRPPVGVVAAKGMLVKVPFRGKSTVGVVWCESGAADVPDSKVKNIEEVFGLPPMPEKLMQFIEWTANYNMAHNGAVLGMAVSGIGDQGSGIREKKNNKTDPRSLTPDHWQLTAAQNTALDKLLPHIRADNFNVTLLDGVTGSGKTEVYFSAIRKSLEEHPDNQILIMLPEIALTQSLIERVKSRLGITPTVWHSNLTPKKRRENWLAIATGDAKLIIGARSSLFLPYLKLSLIVVDEEHDASYKQEEGVVYNARDMAVVRASIEKIPIILVSATPSLETVVNVKAKKYDEINLPARFGDAKMPEIELVDLRKEKREKNCWVSEKLRRELAENLARGEQSLLYLNRRGYAPLTLCRACGHHLKCPYCSAYLVQHGKNLQLLCHHCGHSSRMPEKCPECQEKDTLIPLGPGIERLEEEIKDFLPQARILTLSSDTVESAKAMKKAFADIEDHNVDIIIGTQMVAKGHHFPQLTLVGIIDADSGLAGGDFRAAERTFQVLHQVSGRAGREKLPGKVIIQTFQPESRVIQTILANDRHAFMVMEMRVREDNNLPPFGRLAALIISGKKEAMVRNYCNMLAKSAPMLNGVKILGPAPAPLTLLRGKFRYRFLVKANKSIHIQKIIRDWLNASPVPSSLKVKVDIDPYSFV